MLLVSAVCTTCLRLTSALCLPIMLWLAGHSQQAILNKEKQTVYTVINIGFKLFLIHFKLMMLKQCRLSGYVYVPNPIFMAWIETDLLEFFTLSKNVVKTWRLGGQLHERKSLKGKVSPQCLVPVCKKVHHSPPVFESTSTPPSTSITILFSGITLHFQWWLWWVNQYNISWITKSLNQYILSFTIHNWSHAQHSIVSNQYNGLFQSKDIVFTGMVWRGILYP